MEILPFQAEIARQMLTEDDQPFSSHAAFVRTPNNYWIVWDDERAAVWAGDENIPCDWVEGAESLQELYAMVSNGEWDLMQEADDEEWECGESCACGGQH